MSENQHLPPPLPFGRILHAVNEGNIHDVDLPNITEHPYDTSLLSGEYSLPEGYNDIREAAGDFTSWQPDAIVVGTFRFDVRYLASAVRLLAETTGPDVPGFGTALLADFNLGPSEEWDADALASISQLGLRRFVGAVKIIGSQNQRSYNGALDWDLIYALEKPFDGDYDKLEGSERVLIEGKVSNYRPKTAQDSEDTEPTISVRQADSRRVEISLRSFDRLEFGSSVLIASESNGLIQPYPHPIPPYPLPGETVQISTAFHRPLIPGARGELRTTSSDSAHLLQTTAERMTTEWRIRQETEDIFTQVSTLGISAANKLFSHYVATKIEEAPSDRPFVLIDSLQNRFNEMLREKISPEDILEDVQPLIVAVGSPEPALLIRHLGTEVLHMRKGEFTGFAFDVCYGNQMLKDEAAVDFLFKINSEPDTLRWLSHTTLWAFYDRFDFWAGHEKDSPPLGYAKTLLENGLKHLNAKSGADSEAEALAEITLQLIKRESVFSGLRDVALQALTDSLMSCAHWSRPVDSIFPYDFQAIPTVRGIAAPRALSLYMESMPQILATLEETNQAESLPRAYGGPWEPYRHHIVRLQSLLTKLTDAQNRGERDSE